MHIDHSVASRRQQFIHCITSCSGSDHNYVKKNIKKIKKTKKLATCDKGLRVCCETNLYICRCSEGQDRPYSVWEFLYTIYLFFYNYYYWTYSGNPWSSDVTENFDLGNTFSWLCNIIHIYFHQPSITFIIHSLASDILYALAIFFFIKFYNILSKLDISTQTIQKLCNYILRAIEIVIITFSWHIKYNLLSPSGMTLRPK